MKNVIIINASGHGKEVYWVVKGSPKYDIDYVLKGFLDDRPDILRPYSYEHPILSSVEAYEPQANDVFICAIANPKDKLKYATMIKNKGGKFMNVIHYSALLSANIEFGEGVIIGSFSSLSCDCKIGNFVTINSFVAIGHDVTLSDYAHVNSYAAINGGVEVGPLAVVNTHAVILPRLSVGQSAVVGAGSVVIKNVPEYTTVFGVPATPVLI